MKKIKWIFMVAIVALLFAMTACGNAGSSKSSDSGSSNTNNGSSDSGSSAKTTKTETINLYTSEPQDLVGKMMNDFESKNPGIKVNIYRSGTEKVIAKLEAEKAAGGIQADIIWAADIDYFHQLAQNGKLLETHPANAQNLDKKFIYEGGKYYEVRQIFNILAYNTSKVKKPLTSWSDLARSDLKGKAAMANPNYSGAAFMTLATVVHNDKMGWNYFKSLKANDLKFEQSNGTLANKVASGEYSAVSVVDFVVRAKKEAGAPVQTVWPKEGAILIPTPVGILKSSKVQDADKKLMNYLLSTDAQKMFVSQNYIPVKTDAGAPKGAPKVSDIKLMGTYDESYTTQHRDEMKSKFSSIFGVK